MAPCRGYIDHDRSGNRRSSDPPRSGAYPLEAEPAIAPPTAAGSGIGWSRLSRIAALLAFVASVASGCGLVPDNVSAACLPSEGEQVLVLVTATSTDDAPSLNPETRSVLRTAAEAADATDGPDGRGSSVDVVTADGQHLLTAGLTPRRLDCSIEHGPARDTVITENIDQVAAAVAHAAASRPGLDMLRAIDDATRGRAPSLLVIIGHGLSTEGALDIRSVRFDSDPAVVADQVQKVITLPRLVGWSIRWQGLGSVSGAQSVEAQGPVLPRSMRERLQGYYREILHRAGAEPIIFDDSAVTEQPATSTADMPVIPVPVVAPVPGQPHSASIPGELLGFGPNSAELPVIAGDVLTPMADRILTDLKDRPGAVVTIEAFVADARTDDGVDGVQLSQARAEACRAFLIARGVTNRIDAIGRGVPPHETAWINGAWDERVAASMRRSVITW